MNVIDMSRHAAELCRAVHKWRILYAHEMGEEQALHVYAGDHDISDVVADLAAGNLVSLAPDPVTPLLHAAEQLDRHAHELEKIEIAHAEASPVS
jgi:hypothetical protein